MRWIDKGQEPSSFSEWRAVHRADPNFGYDLIDAGMRLRLRLALVTEQGGLCAYTGRRISEESCHIEHANPQAYCEPGQDVSYDNMLACVPAPNNPGLPYGAHKKGSWPDRTQRHLFVSPLDRECETRFSFTLRGEIRPRNPHDVAAQETITRLGLDHTLLNQLRKVAIEHTIGPVRGRAGTLDVSKARRRIARLKEAERTQSELEPFCFVLKQALERHIKRLEAIRAQRKTRG